MRLVWLAVMLVLATVCLVGSPIQLFVVEICYIYENGGRRVEYRQLEWSEGCSLSIKLMDDVKYVIIRVDSLTPFKPKTLLLDGVRVVPSLDRGIAVVEDFIYVNISKLGYRPRSLTVLFGNYDPKPPIYALLVFNSSPKDVRIWGYLVRALVKSEVDLTTLDCKYTVILDREIELPTSFSKLVVRELVILVTGSSAEYVVEAIGSEAIDIEVIPLNYAPLSEVGGSADYIYVNSPATCEIKLSGFRRAGDFIISRAFMSNPMLVKPDASFRVELPKACPILVRGMGEEINYVVSGVVVAGDKRVRLDLDPLRGSFVARAYRRGVQISSLKVYGIAPSIRLTIPLSNLKVRVVNLNGRPVDGLRVIISSFERILSEGCMLEGGECLFSHLPLGRYTISIFMGSREVGSYEISLKESYEELEVEASIVDVNLSLTYLNGDVLRDYELVLVSEDLKSIAGDRDGVVVLENLPLGLYNLTVLRNGHEVARASLKVCEGRTRYLISVNLAKLYIKVMDFIGRPLEGVEVRVTGEDGVVRSLVTEEGGSVVFDVAPGLYEVEVVGFNSGRRIRVGDEEYVVLKVEPPWMEITMFLLACVMLVVVARMYKVRRSELLVLEVEER